MSNNKLKREKKLNCIKSEPSFKLVNGERERITMHRVWITKDNVKRCVASFEDQSKAEEHFKRAYKQMLWGESIRLLSCAGYPVERYKRELMAM